MFSFRHAFVLLILALPTLALAQQSDGPVFKRIAVPKPGEKPKIDVQIDPDSYFAYLNPQPGDVPSYEPAPNSRPDDPVELPYGSFWLDARDPVKGKDLQVLLGALAATDLSGPRLQELQDISNAYGTDILKATIGTRVSPALALAVISVESGGRPEAKSGAGAQGLMQLIPATAERFAVTDAYDPAQNIRGGVAYLDWLMNEFDGHPARVLAGYNAGENAVIRHEGAPPYAETRAYVPKVLAAWRIARDLCQTPPELLSDGCVFKTIGAPNEG